MATARQRKTKLKNKHLVKRTARLNLDNLAPGIAAGITQGASAKEALQEFPVQKAESHAPVLAEEGETFNRVPVWRAVLRDDTHAVWEEAGLLRRNHEETVLPEVLKAMKAGYICIRCKEPHPEPFPEACDLCGYPMRERQAMDVAVEFRGETTIGPAMAIGQWESEQQARMEEREYEEARKEGHSPMIAVSRKLLSPGAKKLRGLTGKEHATPGLVKAMEKAEKSRAKKD